VAAGDGAGGLRSVVAATAEQLCFTHCLEGRCSQRLRATDRNDAELPIDDNPAKELQAAPLQLRGGRYDGRRRSADAELWRPC